MGDPATPLRYYGGKGRHARFIVDCFPPHQTYVEPFGGGAACLLAKPRAPTEIYNDLDSDVVHVFRCLRDPELAERLRQLCTFTPYARQEFDTARDTDLRNVSDPVERARLIIFKSKASITPRPDNTAFLCKIGPGKAKHWAVWPNYVEQWVTRLRGVQIENRDAFEMFAYDSPDTLFYCDPPYLRTTRLRPDQGYYHDMDEEGHRDLAELLYSIEGKAVISAYPCDLYDELYGDWHRIDSKKGLKPMGGLKSTRASPETIWLNDAAYAGSGSLL